MKRRESYKTTPSNDLASLSSNLNSSLIDNSNTNNALTSTTNTTTNTNLLAKETNIQSSIGNTNLLSNSTNSITTSNKHKLKEICIQMPVAKPSLNELKPQLSIENKQTKAAKTLIERRGSNNSLTLTLNPVKKKLQISSPSKECSTIEYLTKQSRLLSINELIDISKTNLNLYNEFYFLPFNHAELSVVGSGIKNRYKTIVPNESTRVKLSIRNNDPLSSYINANYISGYKGEPKSYIAAQGPMSNTISDFWLMIWTENVSCIVMITKLIERNKNKCELYLPEDTLQTVVYDDIFITVKQINYYQDYEVRQLIVQKNNETRIIYHYWYTAWPDHNLPENPNALIQLIKQVESYRNYDDLNVNKSPILVHCSAGVGRTGCFLALAIGIKQLDVENLVDIVQIVCQLRVERGGMIQTLEQYEFIYQVLAYYCLYYKKIPLISTSSSLSPSLSVSSPSSICLKSPNSTSSSFTFNTQTIQ